MNEFSQLTDAELHQVSERLYHGVMRLFDAATVTFAAMSQTATWTAQYAELNGRAGVLMAAGREQDQLLREVSDLIRGRREQAAARARLAAMDLGTDSEWNAIREATAIDAADRRDDPLMKEH
jgi:hypothetical protein